MGCPVRECVMQRADLAMAVATRLVMAPLLARARHLRTAASVESTPLPLSKSTHSVMARTKSTRKALTMRMKKPWTGTPSRTELEKATRMAPAA